MNYHNLPRTVGKIISLRMATLAELDTVYGIEDVYLMLEINLIDSHNRNLASKEK